MLSVDKHKLFFTISEEISGFEKWKPIPSISGGGLGVRYFLHQFHFHWHHKDYLGSEHTLDSLHFPIEVHLVHLRENFTYSDALSTTNGLAVVAVFFAFSGEGDSTDTHPFSYIRNSTNTSGANIMIRPADLIPTRRNVWFRYNGSLTTPNCEEVVVWTILAEPNLVNFKRLSDFRAHLAMDNHLEFNGRRTQPLNNRKIYMRVAQPITYRGHGDSVVNRSSYCLFLSLVYFAFRQIRSWRYV
ncbi:hypothetical protein AB6A40_004116 [Gnathostoma spinigerum]|uniref:Carbonic anhydrase n=1 Tax=Gnathostoma spinigerum TaxID=75299 RepID=A0ABD6ELF7_9BILA